MEAHSRTNKWRARSHNSSFSAPSTHAQFSHCLLFQETLLNIAVRISVGRAWKSVLVTSFPRGFLSTLTYGNHRREVECKDGNAQA